MAEIRPFRCIRPSKEAASAVAALPYDVYDRKEAKEIVKKNPVRKAAALRLCLRDRAMILNLRLITAI